jgi:hypothetical protein
MNSIERRIARLEQRSHFHLGGVGAAIALQGAETVEQACKRLGLKDASGHIVVGEILEPEHWCRVARLQQQSLENNF